MPNIPEMTYLVHKDSIELLIPLTSQGKFRCKQRSDFQDYGKGLAPKNNKIPYDAYMEWQIGYDKVVENDKKNTTLPNLTFIGANGKKKNPYELSEILYYMCEKGLVSKEEMISIKNEILLMNKFLQDEFQIQSIKENSVNINHIDFYKSVISLPTFIKKNNVCEIFTEITIQKQQYATGVQPMLYLIIPVKEFTNSAKIINHTSSTSSHGILEINKKNKNIILDMVLCFGMCSKAHHHDILEILNLILENAFK